MTLTVTEAVLHCENVHVFVICGYLFAARTLSCVVYEACMTFTQGMKAVPLYGFCHV